MDTLSRKHRLRQQQQLQRAREQQKYQQRQLEVEYQVVSSRKHQVATNGVKHQHQRQVEEEEEFRVYKVVEVVRGERPPAAPANSRMEPGEVKQQQAASDKRKLGSSGKLNKSNGISGPNNGSPTADNKNRSSSGHPRLSSSSSLWPTSASNGHHFDADDDDEEEEDDEDEDDDVGGDDSGEEFAIQLSSVAATNCRHHLSQNQRGLQHQQKSLSKNYQQQQHRCSTDSTKSIGDAGSSSSSGFLSSEGGSSRPHSIRSSGRLLDELDKLMNVGKVSPSDDSYLSLAAETTVADSTLIRHRELDYSQVCRDEFSSFIELAPPPQLLQQKAGPVLVGVHVEDESRPSSDGQEYNNWSNSNSSSNFESGREEQSSGALSPFAIYRSPSDKSHHISKMLNSHLIRVDCLLRLTRGDRTVSMDEAFGSLNDILEEVSSELRTPLEFGPLEQGFPHTEMIQQTETIELADAELDQLDEQELERRCSVQVVAGWQTVLASATFHPPAHLELDWSSCSNSSSADGLASMRRSDGLSQSIESLERSLIERLLSSQHPKSNKEEAKLVKTIVRRHMSDFIERYLEFQSELKANTKFATDWHQNWLFAWKRPMDQEQYRLGSESQQAKRTKLGDCNHVDLFKYSTLILSNPKYSRVKVSQPVSSQNSSSFNFSTESFYEAQQDLVSELEMVERESRGQINPCNLLAMDDTCDKENNWNESVIGGKRTRNQKERHLLVKYATSYVPTSRNISGLQFIAYGYLFESSLFKLDSRKSAIVGRQILNKLRDLLLFKPQSLLPMQLTKVEDRLHFTVNLTNVELVNQLPVVQFCAKIAGRLPVRVRWFRLATKGDGERQEEVELSDPVRLPPYARRSTLRQYTTTTGSSYQDQSRKWPLDMHATSELVYQNEWSSWFRFRRFHNELLFEIREAKLEQDYGQVYRCLVENCCSQSECTFSLTKANTTSSHQVKVAAEVDQNNNSNKKLKKENNKAILRTWSQRTLRQKAPETMRVASEEDEAARSSWQQTIDRRSSVLAAEAEDKFGHHFPYHPVNLLKRLEENKFSPLKCKPIASGRPSNINVEMELVEMSYGTEVGDSNQVSHFAESLQVEQQMKPLIKPRLDLEMESEPHKRRQAMTEVAGPQSSENSQVPKPRLRLHKPQPPQAEQQVSCSSEQQQQQEQVSERSAPEVELERPRVAPKPKPMAMAISNGLVRVPRDAGGSGQGAGAGASVKSLISRFSVA